jgi:cyclase
MLARRVIACLDVDRGRVVKGTGFVDLVDRGDPVELAVRYQDEGADEICLLDVGASPGNRATAFDVVRRAAERLCVPLTLGGGIRSAGDAARALRAGADKIGVNTAAVADPDLLGRMAQRFGSQCVVASIDAKRENGGWRVCTHGGRVATDLDAVAWARECVRRGAGEILLTSMDRDGTRDGYDLDLTRAVAGAVPVPVIASGGAGCAEHLRAAIVEGGADAVLLAGILHEGRTRIAELKAALGADGIPIRRIE